MSEQDRKVFLSHMAHDLKILDQIIDKKHGDKLKQT